MFSLSVGIERLMKLILVYEELISKNEYSINPKNLGHNLDKLYEETQKL